MNTDCAAQTDRTCTARPCNLKGLLLMAGKRKKEITESYDILGSYDTEPMPASRPSPRKNKKKKRIIIRNTILITLAVIMALTGSGFIYYYKTIDSLNYSDTGDFDEDENYAAGARKENKNSNINLGDGSVNMLMEDGKLLNDPMVLNVMLFGADKNDGTSQRSDTMIMLSVDNRHKKLKLTSFMRDLWVYIPDYGYSKLNHSYAYGGPKLAIATIEQNFGVNIDREGDTRIHMVSATGLLEASHRLPALDYRMLMQLTMLLTNSMNEVLQMFRLMCFNVFAHNQDDHAKNFAFIYRDGDWHFAPAYDI